MGGERVRAGDLSANFGKQHHLAGIAFPREMLTFRHFSRPERVLIGAAFGVQHSNFFGWTMITPIVSECLQDVLLVSLHIIEKRIGTASES